MIELPELAEARVRALDLPGPRYTS